MSEKKVIFGGSSEDAFLQASTEGMTGDGDTIFDFSENSERVDDIARSPNSGGLGKLLTDSKTNVANVMKGGKEKQAVVKKWFGK